MFSAVRSRLGVVARSLQVLTSVTPSLAPHAPLPLPPVRRQGWWTPPGGGMPPGFSSRWITPNTYELTVDMGQGSGGVAYDTRVGPNGEIHITARWGDGQVAHLRHSLPPGVDPGSVTTTLGDDGVIKITAKLR